MPLCYIDYFELKAFEIQQMQREIFSELPLSAKRAILQKEINCHKSTPPAFHPSGKIDLSQERRLEINTTPRETLLQTVKNPIYSSKGPFIFPKNHLLNPTLPASHSLSPIRMAYKPSNLPALRGIHFFACDAPVHVILKVNNLYSYLYTFLQLIFLLSVYFIDPD